MDDGKYEKESIAYRAAAEQERVNRIKEFEDMLLPADGGNIPRESGSASLNGDTVDIFDGNKIVGYGTADESKTVRAVRSVGVNIHRGHRARLRESARRDAMLNGFSDIEILETLLSFAVPRKDTNPIAHALLDKFGSLLDVMRAPKNELIKVRFMTKRAAEMIPMLSVVGLWNDKREIEISSHSQAVEFFGSIFTGGTEGACAAYLDGSFRLIAVEKHDSIALAPREIVGSAYKLSARYVTVSCNDDVFDDRFDIVESMTALSAALRSVNTRLLDCLLFTEYGYYTFGGVSDDGYVEFVFVPLRRASLSPELIYKLNADE